MQEKKHQNKIHLMLDEPIAIIGMNCQFPGMGADVEDVESFYEMLIKEQTPIREVPENRWDINQYYDVDRQKDNKIISRKGGFMEDPRLFDATFFKITPTEAKQMDPQHRLFLEVAIRALNHANITLDSLKDSNTGVYCGISTNDYNQLNYKEHIHFNAYTYIGSADSAAAGRLSYFLNLKGPCLTVDTACSSSLAALHLATMALRNNQCDMAIVGGVHFSLCPETCVGLTKANMLSARGQCSSFDAKADGYARSEGCGVIVVKRLKDALKDNNKIHALVRSVTMNQDGGGMGMAAPNIEAQIAMHQSVLDQAHLTARDIDYIETHGTGTVVGDSIEFNAIQHIHKGQHSNAHPLIIGAVKSNIGHTISASGMAGLIKVITSFKYEMIPANLHYSKPNPSIDPDSIPALLPVKATPFVKQQHKKRYAQVSNFGFTGTNVSTILEEPPEYALNSSDDEENEPQCFVVSAKSEYSLKLMLASHLRFLKNSSARLRDVCATLINCRDHYKYRYAMIAKNKEELIHQIESKAYEFKKVVLQKIPVFIENNAQQIYHSFLSGENIKLDKNTESYNKVDLPLYFFDRKSYWHDTGISEETQVSEDWCFHLEWMNQPINKSTPQASPKPWLLLGANHLAPGFIEGGLHLVLDESDVVFDSLGGIIFAVDDAPISPNDIDAHVDFQKNTLKKFLDLIKNLQHKEIDLRIIILTKNSVPELLGDTLNLDGSVLLGFCKTLALELPQFQTILIDLDKQDERFYPAQVLHEIHYNHSQNYEHVVAYRNGQRWVSRLNRASLPNKNQSVWGEGRYLITGGCGGLGLITAQALLSLGAKELILVSRHVDDLALITRIETMQSQYPNQIITPIGLDITDKDKLKQLFLENNKDGLLKGIIHAAGVSRNAPLLEYQDEDVDTLFSAKVKGGWYLHELSQNCDLDFFIVYSSVSSVFGSNKESIYSGTNSFLDALIAERRRLGLVGTAIQWGPWGEAGMAEKRARDQALKHAFISKDQGRAFIHRLLHTPLSHTTIISPEYLMFMLDFVPKPQPLFYQDLKQTLTGVKLETEQNDNLSPWLNEYLKIKDDKKFRACKDMLSALCKEILGIPETEELEEDEGFFDIGLDSLMVAEIASRLKEKLKPILNVTATIGFDYPSINKLSQYMESELNKTLIQPQILQASPQPVVDDSIAIISMSCSLPNAPDISAFETLLEQGLSGIKDIPKERWDNSKYYDPNPDAPGKLYVNRLGLLEDIKTFDAQFFGISPREATLIDPQQRLFLEHCYMALENANYPVQSLRGSLTGVFAGVGSMPEYYSKLEQSGLSDEELGMFAITGKTTNMVPGRVAYTFDLKGPALSIDTACSSSLAAIHYACQSLKNREIDFALAGGVNVLLRPEGIINLCKAKALSLESQCKTFDEGADGYIRSEGCGVLFLKRISDALRDNDTILAVIKGSAINNDGKSAGLTVPNGKSQEEVMQKALTQSSLSSQDISFIETHGTGTPLGDPIEVHAINHVYGHRSLDNPLYLGALKTNLGHLESAAGVASVIKVVLSLQKGRIYKNINFHRLNPKIKLDDTRL
ncbi:type I polyketide synthase, partial [Legionella wadsworthii]